MSSKAGKKKQNVKIEAIGTFGICDTKDCVDCIAEKNGKNPHKKEGSSASSEPENDEFRFLFEPIIEYFKKNHTSMAQNNSMFSELMTRFVFFKKEVETKRQDVEEEHNKELEKLKEMLTEKFDGNRYVQVMIGAMEGRIEEINETVQENEKDKENLQKEINKWKKEATELKKQNDALKNANLLSLTSEKPKTENSEIAKLKKKLEARDKQLKAAQFTKNDKEKLNSLEMIVLKKDERIETMDKEIDKLEDALDELRKKLAAVDKCKINEAGEVKRLNEKIERQRLEISEIQATNIELRTELVKYQQNALNAELDVPVILNLNHLKVSEPAKPAAGKSNNKKKPTTSKTNKIPELMKIDLTANFKKQTPVKQEGKKCCICIKKFDKDEAYETCNQCSNGFHSTCVLPWVRNTGTCPSCRVK